MWVQLVAQHLELRFLRQCHSLQNSLLLLLLGFVVTDTEVESAPTQQQVRGGNGAPEQLEQRLELPGRLGELSVGEIDDRPQRKRGDVTGGENAEHDSAWRAAPEQAVDVPHGHRDNESGERCYDNDLRVAVGLLVEERAEVLRN